jgi:hypothetical protein
MADTKISALPSAGALAGTEPLPIVQGGVTVKTTVQDIADLSTPDLQQVLDAGSVATGEIRIDDGGGDEVHVAASYVRIINPLGGSATIASPTLDEQVAFELPDKPAGTQTFAMLSDLTGAGVASVTAGTNISVTGTSTNPIINSLSDRYKTASTTSNSVSNGAKTFTVDADLSYIPLQEVLIVANTLNHMHGTVTSYSGTTLVVDIDHHTGGGTFTSWVINLDGTPVDAITGSGTAGLLAEFSGGNTIQSVPDGTYARTTEAIAYALILG